MLFGGMRRQMSLDTTTEVARRNKRHQENTGVLASRVPPSLVERYKVAVVDCQNDTAARRRERELTLIIQAAAGPSRVDGGQGIVPTSPEMDRKAGPDILIKVQPDRRHSPDRSSRPKTRGGDLCPR